MGWSGKAALVGGAAVVVVVGVVVLAEDPQSAVPLAAAPAPSMSEAPPAPAPTPTPTPTPTTASPSPTEAVPPGPVPAEVITNGSRDIRKVALTFDADLSEASLKRVEDGRYPPQYNEPIIDYLEANQVPATVFVTGLWAQTYSDAVRRMNANPLFTIGNHSWDHLAWTTDCYGLPSVEQANKQDQVLLTAGVIQQITGKYPAFYRFPGLCHNEEDVQIVADAGERTVDFDMGSSDAFAKNPDAVAAGLMESVQPGSILLFHLNGAPNAPVTEQIVEQIVPALREQGYQIVPLAELVSGAPAAAPAASPAAPMG